MTDSAQWQFPHGARPEVIPEPRMCPKCGEVGVIEDHRAEPREE